MSRSLASMTDAELLQEIGECISLEGECKIRAKPLREELRRRQTETGETLVSHDGWESRLTREAFSAAWLERQTGYTLKDLPPDCLTEQVTMAVDWEKVSAWMEEHHGGPLAPTYSLTIKREKSKGKKAD